MATLLDTHLSAVHSRVTSALASAEDAIDYYHGSQTLRGRMALQRVVENLQRASDYYKTGGSAYDARRQYVDTLISFYTPLLAAKVALDPRNSKALADQVYNAQGALATADPGLRF